MATHTKNNRIFELNGKAYDAMTGAMLGSAQRVPHTAQVQAIQPKPVPRQHGVSIDGIVGGPTKARAHHSQSKHVSHHQPQPTKTLMRHAVKPPTPAKAMLNAKLSSDIIDPRRAQRAQVAPRSHSVQHFRSVQPRPASPYGLPVASSSSDIKVAHSPASVVSRQAVGRQQPSQLRPIQNARRPYAMPVAATVAQPQATVQDESAYEQDLFEQAIAHATSHEQAAPDESMVQSIKRHSKKRRQVLGIVGSLSVFMLLCGFIAYQNRDDIQLQMASARAGFSASTPLYKPDGYNLDKLTYAPGNVAASYKHANNQAFTVTQKKSNWDSQTLLENFVATSNQDYQGFQSNGRTVYIYGKANATWVNGGIWYQIKDAGNLSSEQLVRIAASM